MSTSTIGTGGGCGKSGTSTPPILQQCSAGSYITDMKIYRSMENSGSCTNQYSIIGIDATCSDGTQLNVGPSGYKSKIASSGTKLTNYSGCKAGMRPLVGSSACSNSFPSSVTMQCFQNKAVATASVAAPSVGAFSCPTGMIATGISTSSGAGCIGTLTFKCSPIPKDAPQSKPAPTVVPHNSEAHMAPNAISGGGDAVDEHNLLPPPAMPVLMQGADATASSNDVTTNNLSISSDSGDDALPPPPAASSDKKWIIIVGGIVAATLLLGGGYAIYKSRKSGSADLYNSSSLSSAEL